MEPISGTADFPPSESAPKAKPSRAVAGRFGAYGGRYVPETLMAALQELESAYAAARKDKTFRDEYHRLLQDFAGRPTPLFLAERMTKQLGGAKIYLKREDLLHTGAHKINNCIGQALLARRMGKHRIIAETGAGQHGVATATVCALFGMECVVYMGTEDMRRQELNVFRMRLLGAEVRGVESGSRTLKDAINEAMRDWVTNVRTTHYLLGSVLGAHPYPTMVRDFHRVISQEARKQILKAEGRLPSAIIACVGGGSNAIGVFYEFIKDAEVKLIGVEQAGVVTCLASMLHASMAVVRACCRGRTPTCCKIKADRSQRRIRFRRGWTIPRSDLSTRCCTIRDAPSTCRPRTRKPWMRARRWRGWKASSLPSNRRTRDCRVH